VVDRIAGRFVDQYIAVSDANRRYLVEEKGLARHKVVVIHNGCDLRRFNPHHRAPAGMRESLGFGASDPVLVVVGRLEPQKGHRVLFDALPAVRAQFPRVRLVCVGEGARRQELEQQVAASGLGDTVRFVGQQANVADWLALADVTVLPSFFEGLPLAAIESLAAGRPMVASAVDGTPEVVVDGATGLTVPPGDAAGLARWRSPGAPGCSSDSTRTARSSAPRRSTIWRSRASAACREGRDLRGECAPLPAGVSRAPARGRARRQPGARRGDVRRDRAGAPAAGRRGAAARLRRRDHTAARGGSRADRRADRGAASAAWAPRRDRAERGRARLPAPPAAQHLRLRAPRVR
ncbi:MAG: hypothetical protein DME05_14400, partial [Candidatus Rokuibacteriota bacterium]